MADIIPPANLPPEAQPWGRTVQQLATDLQTQVVLNLQAADNNNKQLTSTINTLSDQIRTGIGNVYTKQEVDTKDAVNATAAANANANADTREPAFGILAPGKGGTNTNNVYNNVFGAGTYRTVWVDTAGTIGYLPSSRELKTDFELTNHSLIGLLDIPLMSWRYKVDVEANGDNATWRTGFIAEDVHDAGETWLVDYNADGSIAGLAGDGRFGMAAIALLQDVNKTLQAHIDTLEDRLSKLENKVE